MKQRKIAALLVGHPDRQYATFVTDRIDFPGVFWYDVMRKCLSIFSVV